MNFPQKSYVYLVSCKMPLKRFCSCSFIQDTIIFYFEIEIRDIPRPSKYSGFICLPLTILGGKCGHTFQTPKNHVSLDIQLLQFISKTQYIE